MESRGNVNYPTASGGGVESFGSTLHWGPSWTANRYVNKILISEVFYIFVIQNRYILTHVDYHHSAKLSDEFHTYGLYWSEDRLYTYVFIYISLFDFLFLMKKPKILLV